MNTQLINNQWLVGKGPAFDSINPSNGEIVWQGNGANAEQVDSDIKAARAAQVQWADMPIEQR
ncbi:aldehyde dehydrogenase family protein, partial [Pseudoalteromonas sp. 41-MNA-CIBAN-0057]|uniref:aldehyde dehydrogenase family protein n=1 Tax=Pseudoalteromonas sp. 41-MNA-CIBAN-0057 TaxID=3140419 RepID=UPI00332783A3